MKTLLTLWSILIVSSASFADAGLEDLSEIRRLMRAGEFEQALDKHKEFHEDSRHAPGMGGVRLSFAIDAWVDLGEEYPPAKAALIELRDKYRQQVLSGNGSRENFHELFAINRALDYEDETLELFLFLDINYPEQAQRSFIVVEEILFRHQKYDISAKYLGDPIWKYEGIRHMREHDLSLARTNPARNDPGFLRYTDSRFSDQVTRLIKVLVAVNRTEEAIEIQQRALSYFPNDALEHAIDLP